MNTRTIHQPFSFRKNEVENLLSLVIAGESASIVGISGVGKSNLFNHLLDPQTLAAYLDEPSKYLFARVNFHFTPDFTARSIYSLILDELETIGEQWDENIITRKSLKKINRYHSNLLDSVDDLLKVQHNFKKAIQAILSASDLKIVFLFDQFDEVYIEAEARTLANLRGLREAYKYRVMFFVFTRETLPTLRAIDSEREEFYELLSSNVIGLKPYNHQDSKNLLERLAGRHGNEVSSPLAEILIQLSGGHAGLLRACYLYLIQEDIDPANENDLVDLLLKQQSIRLECESIWQSLSIEEQRYLAFLSHNLPTEQFDSRVEIDLHKKGMLLNLQIFSPLIAEYINDQGKLWEQSIYFDGRNRRVWISDKAIRLTRIEFRLFKVLYDNRNQVVFKDELSDAGWPEAQGSVTDEMIVASIRRLRSKIEPDPKNPEYIINVRGEGYSLRIE